MGAIAEVVGFVWSSHCGVVDMFNEDVNDCFLNCKGFVRESS